MASLLADLRPARRRGAARAEDSSATEEGSRSSIPTTDQVTVSRPSITASLRERAGSGAGITARFGVPGDEEADAVDPRLPDLIIILTVDGVTRSP